MNIAIKWLLYTILGLIADTLDIITTFFCPRQRAPLITQPPDIGHLSDQSILERSHQAPFVPGPERTVKRLTHNTVVKYQRPAYPYSDDSCEENAQNLLLAKSTIPIPRVHRLIKHETSVLLVMDYIPGQTLARVWPALSTWKKICIAWTLRGYIRQLRHLTAPANTPPGPIARLAPQEAFTPVFGHVRPARGPFTSYSHLAQYFNERQKRFADKYNLHLDTPFDDSKPLVFSHQDINLRNVILGTDDRLWLIDWGCSGYYPEWFEYIAMQNQAELATLAGTDDPFWKLLIPFIAGPYFYHHLWYQNMQTSLEWRY
ncbi:hypothetical protein C0989_008564 [Termitomyces sp. Mn162]|nr:hypothetical protein C0989_008564 [Termitomyces sp. Mn162]